jgi:hypothetical protein
VELCTGCWDELILMGVIVMFSMSREMKETRPILSRKEDHAVASKTGAYWRKGPVNTTW